MRCKRHPADLTSSVGVCASCLRERLLSVMVAQQDRRKSHSVHPPPPLSFPRSVSPYISRRKSETNASTWQVHGGHRSFYSTPQVGPTGSITVDINKKKKKKSNGGRLSSIFWSLFKSKPDKPGIDSDPVSDPRVAGGYCAASPSWYSTINPSRRRKQIDTFSVDEKTIGGQRRVCRNRDRGMSPVRYSDEEGDEHCRAGLSGYSSESSQGWKQTPRRTARQGGTKATAAHSRNISGLALCMSPLVWASPKRQWTQKVVPPELVESRAKTKAHLSAAASFCKNRSRKFADFGRYSHTTNH